MKAQIVRKGDGTARKHVTAQREPGAQSARTEAHFWGMLRDALNAEYAGEYRHSLTLFRPHKEALTSMPYALSRGPNRDEMVIDGDYMVRDVRALYNAGQVVELQVIVS